MKQKAQKKVTPNNYDQAIKEISVLDESLVSKVPNEIDAKDKFHNHVVSVRVMDRPGEVSNKVIVNTLKLNDDKFKKIEKRFKFLGFTKLILLHDASMISEDEKTPSLHVQDVESIELRIKNELEAKHKAEMDELRKKYQSETIESKKPKAEPTEIEIDYQEAMSGNKDELVDFMLKYEISQTGITNNQDRKEAIKSFFESVQNASKYDV